MILYIFHILIKTQNLVVLLLQDFIVYPYFKINLEIVLQYHLQKIETFSKFLFAPYHNY